jgi:hypothetical protein
VSLEQNKSGLKEELVKLDAQLQAAHDDYERLLRVLGNASGNKQPETGMGGRSNFECVGLAFKSTRRDLI